MKKNAIIFYLGTFTLVFVVVACSSFRPVSDSSYHRQSDDLRQAIVSYAMQYEGAKYKYAGTSPRGFDCSGFTSYVMSNFDISLTHQSGVQEGEGIEISASRVQPGDLVFFRKSRGGKVFHVAMVVSNSPDGIHVIHATSSRGVVIDNISTSSYWSVKHMTFRNVIDRH